MPVKSGTRYRVLKDFDFAPAANVVLAFKVGEEHGGLTAACVERGLAAGALEEITGKDEADGRARSS